MASYTSSRRSYAVILREIRRIAGPPHPPHVTLARIKATLSNDQVRHAGEAI